MIGEIIQAVASVLNISSTAPQVHQTFKTRSTADLSLIFLIIGVAGQATWVIFAVMEAKPIWIIGEGLDTAMWAAILIITALNVIRERRKIKPDLPEHMRAI